MLPTGPDPWPFLALANGLAEYLAGAGDTQLNYLAGQTAMLYLAPNEQVTSYVLDIPGAAPVRQTLTPGQTDLSVDVDRSARQLPRPRRRTGWQARPRLQRQLLRRTISELSRVDFAAIARRPWQGPRADRPLAGGDRGSRRAGPRGPRAVSAC